MKPLTSTILLILFAFLPSKAQNISIKGTLWTELDLNSTYDGEQGKNNVKVYLISTNNGQIIDIAFTENFEFNFPSNDSLTILPGEYIIEIASEEFDAGGTLENFISCPGFNQADDGVDLDDNGIDTYPTKTTSFTLDSGLVEHIDLCFFSDCNEEINSAKLSCELINEEDIFCSITSLHNLCGLMPTTNSPGNQPNPLCPDGGAPHNISWFAFIADEGEYQLTVTPTGCFGSTTGIEGVQMGLYTDCTFTESVFCNPDCSLEPLVLDSGLLTPGETYYFFIDGCSSSVCSYEIRVTGNPNTPTTEVEEICILEEGDLICEDSEYCLGEEIVFEANVININAMYSWQITTIEGETYSGEPIQTTEENTIPITFEDIGVYSICLTNLEPQNSCYNWEGMVCRTITISSTEDENFNFLDVCEEDILDFDASILNEEDPNGDGISGWVDLDYEFEFGLNESIVMDSNGCNYSQQVIINEIFTPLIVLSLDDFEICVGDSMVLSFPNNEIYDSIIWTINGIPQAGDEIVIYPDVGEYSVMATLYAQCPTYTTEASFLVNDTISAPDIVCDTSTIGTIILSWPEIEDVDGYWISINEGPFILTKDTFYIVENLDQGEIVSIGFNLFFVSKCAGLDKTFTCIAPTSVSTKEYVLNELKIIPNPALDYISVEGRKEFMKSSYRIYSPEGRLVNAGKIDLTRRIDVTKLNPGLYLLTIVKNDGEMIKVGKFVKRL